MVDQIEDLTPNPRILPMLGEINLAPWKCVAELIDNSVDAFLHEPTTSPRPTIWVTLPMVDEESARIQVRDNGPGMAPDTLATAVKAGWSGNDPISSLGLFGMGFNIATARLGIVTSVWTTRPDDGEWTGLRIDFSELIRQKHYQTPRLRRPKDDPAESGTEIIVERVKQEHRAWFSKAYNRSNLRKDLARTYSSMLRDGGDLISFKLLVDGNTVVGQQHCVWSGDDGKGRQVQLGQEWLNAVQTIDASMASRPYCIECWEWLAADDDACPRCESADGVRQRERRIHGWVGIQRYLSNTNHGIDLIRHGRKIELLNRDLFMWEQDGFVEEEYPIDDPRHRGRIVGEIHLDHCRVPYTKDRFDRTDPAWAEMLQSVRGEGPLRPEKARQLGYAENSSPLYGLYQVFRRSSPKPKVAGSYAKLLIVPDNDRATEMATRFYAGEFAYMTDSKWYELVSEADKDLLRGSESPTSPEDDKDDELLGGLGGGDQEHEHEEEEPIDSPPVYVRDPIASLSLSYNEQALGNVWDVEAYRAESDDPELLGQPWRMKREAATGLWTFLVDTDHPVFRSYTLTPTDALLSDLAHNAVSFAPRSSEVPFATVLAELRSRYSTGSRLDPGELTARASLLLGDIARRFAGSADAQDNEAYFAELTLSEQEHILSMAASRSPENPTGVSAVVGGGRFLEFAGGPTLLRFFESHPELFFDGRQWNRAYSTIDFGSGRATGEARESLVSYYSGLLKDIVWLAERDTTDLETARRQRLLRAALALELLDVDMVPDA